MTKRISEEERNEIKRLYDDGNGLTPTEIAKKKECSYSFVYGLTKLKQRINPETGQLFISSPEYRDYLARVNGHRSHPQYRKKLLEEKGFLSDVQYRKYFAEKKTNPKTGQSYTRKEYRDYLARLNGYASDAESQKHTVEERKKKNQKFANFIKQRLEEVGKNQSWLSRRIGVTKSSVSDYIHAKNLPNKKALGKLCFHLNISPKTLEGLLRDNLEF